MMSLILVFLGGGLGAVTRHSLSTFVMRYASGGFPWGTLAVNLIGAFLIGLIIELSALRLSLSQDMKLLLVTGILGGFTTFSAFSLETVLLLQRGDWGQALAYVLMSVLGCVALVYAGMTAIRV